MVDTTQYICRGDKITQLSQFIPQLDFLYTQFEKDYDVVPLLNWTKENYWVAYTAVALYLAWCYFSKIAMKDKERFDLRYPLAYWNLLLAVFSAYGMVRTVPHMMYILTHNTFEESVCTNPVALNWGCGATGLAVQAFCLSKIPELVDTIFITLRKRELIFLHWYHHFTVLLFCWTSYATESGAGLYFISMNYTVHAIMYFYYFLMAIKVVPKWFPAQIITIMQILQMVVGTFVVGAGVYYKLNGGSKFAPGECSNDFYNMVAGVVMYGSYFLLFLDFAFGRYIYGTRGKKADDKTTETKKSK